MRKRLANGKSASEVVDIYQLLEQQIPAYIRKNHNLTTEPLFMVANVELDSSSITDEKASVVDVISNDDIKLLSSDELVMDNCAFSIPRTFTHSSSLAMSKTDSYEMSRTISQGIDTGLNFTVKVDPGVLGVVPGFEAAIEFGYNLEVSSSETESQSTTQQSSRDVSVEVTVPEYSRARSISSIGVSTGVLRMIGSATIDGKVYVRYKIGNDETVYGQMISLGHFVQNLPQENIELLASKGIEVIPSDDRISISFEFYLTTDIRFIQFESAIDETCSDQLYVVPLSSRGADIDENENNYNVDRLYQAIIGDTSNTGFYVLPVGDSIPDLANISGWNDRISSVTLAPNSSMILYNANNYTGGPPVHLINRYPRHIRFDTTDFGVNDTTSSIKTTRP
ncbi:hypothetical protein [Bacillus cereus]|uniref:hypothetical protein n=1 Tax=Bacillus cereus TaxID=1396 RepID=UPI00107630FF|nr:hypothetical protein [Bacillus cereus]TFZ09406.1 hypothetical protein C6Y54_28590 [Bacillus cereus]